MQTRSAPPPEGKMEQPAKKRRRGSAAPDALGSGQSENSRDQQGNDRPRFLLRFPDDPELSELTFAFEVGDYARVRDQAPRLVQSTTRPEVRRAAEELLRRIEPDPLVKYLLVVAIGLLLLLIGFVYTAHG